MGIRNCIWFEGSPNLNSLEGQVTRAWGWSSYLGEHGTPLSSAEGSQGWRGSVTQGSSLRQLKGRRPHPAPPEPPPDCSFPISVPALRPNERSRVRFEIMPTRSGTKQLLADFSCNKFPAIKSMLSIDVAE